MFKWKNKIRMPHRNYMRKNWNPPVLLKGRAVLEQPCSLESSHFKTAVWTFSCTGFAKFRKTISQHAGLCFDLTLEETEFWLRREAVLPAEGGRLCALEPPGAPGWAGGQGMRLSTSTPTLGSQAQTSRVGEHQPAPGRGCLLWALWGWRVGRSCSAGQFPRCERPQQGWLRAARWGYWPCGGGRRAGARHHMALPPSTDVSNSRVRTMAEYTRWK